MPNRTRYDRTTNGRQFAGPDPYPNPATHILVFFRAPPRQSQCNRSLIRINWLFLILASSQLKSSTLGRVPPYILVKHTRESNRSPPALRSDLGSHRPSHSFVSTARKQESWSFIVFLCGLWRFQSLLGWGWRILKNLVRPSQLLEI